MEGRRIKIRTVRPDQGMDLGIQANLIEKVLITKRAIERPGQDRPKINFAHHAVTKRNP